jgi:hypothetical protein
VRKEVLVLSDGIMSAARTGGVLARAGGRYIDRRATRCRVRERAKRQGTATKKECE